MRVPRDESEKEAERLFEEVLAKNFPKLMKNMNLQIQEAQWNPSEMKQEAHTKTHKIKLWKATDTERILTIKSEKACPI